MKPFEEYEPKSIPPKTVDYTTVYVYDEGTLLWVGSHSEWRLKKPNEFPKNHVIQKVQNREEYNVALKNFSNEQNKLREEFVQDLFEDFDVTENPKAALLYNKIRESVSSPGRIYEEFEDWVELIR